MTFLAVAVAIGAVGALCMMQIHEGSSACDDPSTLWCLVGALCAISVLVGGMGMYVLMNFKTASDHVDEEEKETAEEPVTTIYIYPESRQKTLHLNKGCKGGTDRTMVVTTGLLDRGFLKADSSQWCGHCAVHRRQ